MPARTRSALVILLASACAALPAAGQYSSDPAANQALADRPNDQNNAKLRPTPDGGLWIMWFDNAVGGNKPTLQRVRADGSEVFAHNGLTLANTTNSSTTDFDLAVDPCGNVIVAFPDNSSGTSLVTAMKVTLDGARPWGAAGVQLPQSTGGSLAKVAQLSDGSLMVGWSASGAFSLRRLSESGEPTGDTLVTTEAGHLLTLSDLEAGSDGAAIALWIRTFNTQSQSSKYLYAQRFDGDLQPTWTPTPGYEAVCVYGPPQGGLYPNVQGGSVQNGYFPTMIVDGQGGAVFSWYEVAGARNAFVQRITASGDLVYPLHGRPVSNEALILRLSAAHAFDPATQDIFVAFTYSNTNQSQFGLKVQRVLSEGELGWGDSAVTLLGLSANQNSFARVLNDPDGGGCIASCIDARSTTTGVIQSFKLGAAGENTWPSSPMPVCTTISGKARHESALTTRGIAVFSWGDGRSGANDVYVQNINPDGSYGPLPGPACATDFNNDGLSEPGDLDDFITAFFGDCAERLRADFNGDGLIEPGDLDDFITAFFEGC